MISRLRRVTRFASLVLLGGCDSSAASMSDAAVIDASPPGLGFEHAWRESELCAVENVPDSGCCTTGRIELPATAASFLDLRDLTSGAAGTCGDPVKLMLPSEASAYPLMILLPEIASADPLCVTACAGRGKETTFGIVLSVPDALATTHRPLIVAPPPWRYVYDHNSLAGDACSGGYQEFGERACVRPNYGGSIGFATGASATRSRVALVDLQVGENGAVETCCPYLPTSP